MKKIIPFIILLVGCSQKAKKPTEPEIKFTKIEEVTFNEGFRYGFVAGLTNTMVFKDGKDVEEFINKFWENYTNEITQRILAARGYK